jgi:Rrf2 family protein
MKVSTKGRYGLRCLIDMIINNTGDCIPLNLIASRQKISEQYLEHVFYLLRKANVVKSIRGPQGGYVLAKRPSEITVGQVLRALEGDTNVTYFECDNVIESSINSVVWESINKSTNHIIDSITLDQIVEQYKKIDRGYPYDFVI